MFLPDVPNKLPTQRGAEITLSLLSCRMKMDVTRFITCHKAFQKNMP